MRDKKYQNVLLVIDDDKLFCDVVSDYFSKDNLKVLISHTMAEGIDACKKNKIDIVLLDQHLPDGEGYELCPDLLRCNEHAKIIFITAYPSFENALKAIKGGAYDYLSKPFEMEELTLTVKNALNTLRLENVAQIEDYRHVKESDETVLIGRSRKFAEVLKIIERASSTDAPVLITGETGTGKNIAAKAIHYGGTFRKEAFICVNCSAFPEHLIEAELFGCEKGAYTGATASRRGVFEMADGGTLLLDEIGEMPVHIQSKLLNVLEDKKIKKLGGDRILPVHVRIIAATSADLERVMDRSFRSDLYYRLNIIRIHMPPLRERREDIPEICEYMLRQIAPRQDLKLDALEMEKLMGYEWPGNVRELKNILERAYLITRGPEIRPSDLLGKSAINAHAGDGSLAEAPVLTLKEVEQQYIKSVFEKLSFNITKTARALNVSISTLKRKLRAYSLK